MYIRELTKILLLLDVQSGTGKRSLIFYISYLAGCSYVFMLRVTILKYVNEQKYIILLKQKIPKPEKTASFQRPPLTSKARDSPPCCCSLQAETSLLGFPY